MKEVYLLNDISREDREVFSRVYVSREDVKKEFDERVRLHMNDFSLEEWDFNNDCDWWDCMELTEAEMYDWKHWIEIYFITLPINNG